jgi:hypothetical protein
MDRDGGGDDLASPALGDATPAPPWIPRANAVVTLSPHNQNLVLHARRRPALAASRRGDPRLSPPWSLLPHAAARRKGKGAMPPLISASPSRSIVLWQSSVEPGGKAAADSQSEGKPLEQAGAAGGRGRVEAWMRC